MSKVGVFVCHCGENIARNVKVKDVVEFATDVPGAAVTADYPYLCSAPGQQMVIDAIREHGLDRVVIAACSPQLHEPTFRAAAAQAGLNPHLVEIANIREHCSWVHRDPDQASAKACQTVTAAVERVKRSKPLDPVEVPVTKRALVIGGGVAGIRTALDIANSGHPVVLVEREPSLGGNMSRLSETFPTLDCSQCILTPLMVQVSRHPLIELMTYSEVEGVSGYVGNFTVTIRRKPSFVDPDVCTACGDCTEVCPSPGGSEFDMGLSTRKAIYIPFPQAVPSTYTLDADRCLNSNLQSPTGFRVLACVKCDEVCKPQAINFDMQPEIVERKVGAIVVATGYDLQIGQQAKECGYGELPDVMDGLEFERMLSASGPTAGEVRRPSDGAEPKDVVFIQCVGSRNPKHGVPYCSRICCMYTAKHALLLRHKVPESRAYIFYMDIRAGGKGYEEFVHRAMEEERVMYIRGRVSQVYRGGRQAQGDGGGHPLRQTGRDRRRHGGAGDRDGAHRSRQDREHPADRHRHPRLPQGGPPQAATGGDPDRRDLPRRRRAGAQGHSRHRVAGLGRGLQGHGAVVPRVPRARPLHREHQPDGLRGVLRVPPGLPLRRHRTAGRARP